MQKREIETMKILLANRKTEGNATAQIAHLVFTDTRANGKKLKELFFADDIRNSNSIKYDERSKQIFKDTNRNR